MLHSNDFMLKPTNYIEKNVMQYLTLSKLGTHTNTHTRAHPHNVQTFMLKPANI